MAKLPDLAAVSDGHVLDDGSWHRNVPMLQTGSAGGAEIRGGLYSDSLMRRCSPERARCWSMTWWWTRVQTASVASVKLANIGDS